MVALTGIRTQPFALYFIMSFALSSRTPPESLWNRIIEDNYKHLPFATFCNSSKPPATNISSQISVPAAEQCMLPCSCDTDSCGNKLLCCPDIVQKEEMNSSCFYPAVYGDQLTNSYHPKLHTEFRLRMVHSCPLEYHGSEVHTNCLRYRNTSRLDNLIPVISNQSGIIYVNRFCAECNHVESFQKFNTTFVCSNDLFRLENWDILTKPRTPENQIELIKNGHCMFIFKLSNESGLEDNRCIKPRYTSCNQTGLWDFTDPYWVDACSAYELPYEDYRNIHCYFCNRPSVESYSLRQRCLTPTHHVLKRSFYCIIDLDLFDKQWALVFERHDLDYDEQNCTNRSDAVMDPYMDICRSFQCPLFKMMQQNNCVHVYSGFEFIPVSMTLLFQEINGSEHLRNPNYFSTEVVPVLKQQFLSSLVNMEKLCRFSISTPRTGNNKIVSTLYSDEFVVDIAWFTSSSDNIVPEKISTFFNLKFVNLDITNTSGKFKVRLTERTYFQRKHYSFVYILPTGLICHDTLQVSKVLICKRIVLEKHEFNISDGNIFLKSGFMLKLPDWHILRADGIEMCLDDYISHTNKTSGNSIRNLQTRTMDQVTIILSFGCSMLSIICLSITDLTYILFKPLRTTPGKINMFLCLSLLMAQIFQQFTIDITEYRIACIVCGSLTHFFWLATLLWMNISSFHLFRHFSPINTTRLTSGGSGPSLYLYVIYVLVLAALLVCTNTLYSYINSKGNDFGYGITICYISSIAGLLFTFIVPVGLIVVANAGFLLVTVWHISHIPKPEGSQTPDRNNVVIYLKMSTLTGLCWLFGFFRIWTGHKLFEILFILANASQGMFLMLSFICNWRVFGYYKSLLYGDK